MNSSKFEISTLAGVTKIDGNYNAGDYAYDLITLTNVETVQFNDTLLSLDTSSQSIIEGTSWSDVLTGTSGDDIFDSKGGNDTIDGLSGNDQLLIFEDSYPSLRFLHLLVLRRLTVIIMPVIMLMILLPSQMLRLFSLMTRCCH